MDIQEYKRAIREVDRLEKIKEIEQKKISDRRKIVHDKYWKLERLLRERENKEEMKIEGEEETLTKNILNKKDPFLKTITEVERFFRFVNIYLDNCKADFEIYYFEDHDDKGFYISDREKWKKILINPIDSICDDEFKVVGAYIMENRKPKNRYTLAICGKSIFGSGDDNDGLYRSSLKKKYYLSVIPRISGCNIEHWVKDLPEREQLQEYYLNRKHLILGDFLKFHQQVEQEYKQAIDLFEQDDWQLLYWENRKDYYARRCYNGKESDEYKEAIGKIEQLQQNHKRQLAMV